MHAAQPQQPRRAAASAAVPLEYLQCVYSHTLLSQHPQRASTAQPLSDQPMRSQALPTAAAAIPVANQKPHALSSICSREAE